MEEALRPAAEAPNDGGPMFRSDRYSHRGSQGPRAASDAVAVALRAVALIATGAMLLGLGLLAIDALTKTGPAPAPVASAPAEGAASVPTGSVVASAPSASTPSTSTVSQDATRKVDFAVAWQPSHQGDTGHDWHEYVVCGGIVDAAIAALPEFTNVKAWDIKDGLTGTNNYRPRPTNTGAFDKELAVANKTHAGLFISIHNDGAAPSGVLAEYIPGDKVSKALAIKLVRSICETTGLPNRGTRATRLYSMETVRNVAKYRVLLEVGDNAKDRRFLLDKANWGLVGQAMAKVIRQQFGPR